MILQLERDSYQAFILLAQLISCQFLPYSAALFPKTPSIHPSIHPFIFPLLSLLDVHNPALSQYIDGLPHLSDLQIQKHCKFNDVYFWQ